MREQFTLGVEEEYQLVEPGTGELRSRAGTVLAADLSGAVEGEVQDTMLEIGTPVCRDASEVAQRLRERRFQAGAAAASEDLEVLALGTHPWSGWKEHRLTEAERPRMLSGVFRHLLRQEHIWGMHVHVAVPEEIDRLEVMNTVRSYTPHLLALSCSSPFHAGEDTGFDSFRTVTWRRFPFTGTPPRFESEEEHHAFLDTLLRAGVIPDRRTLYWSVRASTRYPTIELRVCDVCPRISDAVAIASLGRALVVAAAEGSLKAIGCSLSKPLQDVVLVENEWIAARDGLDATLIAPESEEGGLPIRDAITRLLETARPVLESLGDTSAVSGIETILEKGNAAERMRRRHTEAGDLRSVVDWAVQETRAGTGMDRRRETRKDDRVTATNVKEEG